MKLKMRSILTVCLLAVTLLLVSGCSSEKSPYEVNDGENFTVSVKYDANGGFFTTNTYVITDSYNISEMQSGSNGQVEIALLSPDNANRGADAFTVTHNGYFLAGWYSQRTDTGTTDSKGNPVYTYANKWDFDTDRLEVDANGTYTSAEPVLTLYAAWVPMFEIEFYSLDSGEYLDTMTFDPTLDGEIQVPAWDEETGAIQMNDFPKRDGYTFNAAYYDAEGTQGVTTDTVVHPGTVDYATGTAANSSMKLYVDWMEGEWYHIYTARQFVKNASLSGNYVIHADLDFAEEIWPTSLMYGNFSGSIQGNGYAFKNVEATQTNNSKVNAGLFGNLTDTAQISGVNFENVTFTIQSGTRVKGTSYGLLAGNISTSAVVEDVTITSGTLQIDSGCYFGTDDYTIGLVCGSGNAGAVDASGITCIAVGDAPEKVVITVSGNQVTVAFVTE